MGSRVQHNGTDGLRRPMNPVAFQAYIGHVLVPMLRRGDTVIMDNSPARKRSDVHRITEDAVARLMEF